MRNLYLISKEDFINLIKNPMWVFYQTLFPILLILIMGFLTKGSYGNMITSYDYYGITLIIYSVINSGMTSANAFMEDRIKKPNMRIIYSPGNVGNIYLSKIISSFAFCFVFHLLDMAIICVLFHVKLNHILEIALILGLTELFSVTLGVAMCCIFKTEQMANQILSVIVNMIAIFGGLLFSLDGYGKIARTISMISPAKYVRDCLFQMIYDNNLSLFVPTVLILIISTVVMVFICKKNFKKEDCIC